MRHALLALLVGLAAGWLGHDLLGGREAPPADGLSGEPAPAGRSSGGPALAANAGAGGDGLADEAVRAVRALERARSGLGAARVRGLAALALLQAVAGSEDEFLRVALRALEAGSSLDELLPALREFPPEVAGRLLARLLDAGGKAPYDVVEVSRMLADGGQGERALALVKGALPSRVVPEPELLRLLLRLDPAQGPAALLALEGSERWDADTLGVLRALLIETGQDRELVPFLTRALAARPGDADLLRWLARVDPAAAEDRLRARLRSAPDDGKAWSLLADLRRDAGDKAGSFDAYRRAAELSPGRSTFKDLVRADPARGLEAVVGWAKDSQDDERLGTLGEMYLLAGRKDDALRTFLTAHEHDPEDGAWIEQAIGIDPAATATVLERRLSSLGASATDELLGRYAQALAASGRREEAFAQYAAAFQKDPSDGDWQAALVATDPARALPLIERQVRDHPNDAGAAGSYGVALAAAGRRAEALEALESALAWGEARRWYRHLAGLDPERALVALDRRTRTEGSDPDLWALLGAQLKERNRREEARRAYEAAARLDPANRSFAEALRELR